MEDWIRIWFFTYSTICAAISVYRIRDPEACMLSAPNIKLYGYPSGTWGLREAQALFDNPQQDWRYPCRNLTGDGEFREL